MEHHLKQQLCPVCGHHLDAASNVGPAGEDDPKSRPAPGDVTVCIGCGEVLEFLPDDALRVFTEWEQVPADVMRTLRAVQLAVREVRKSHPDKQEAVS